LNNKCTKIYTPNAPPWLLLQCLRELYISLQDIWNKSSTQRRMDKPIPQEQAPT
jgi:hypothetical protein